MSKPDYFYHASEERHKIGEVWTPRKNIDWLGPAIGSIIEKFRPPQYTS